MRILFLGTGTSHGVPVIGCHCPVCTSSDPHDRRMRSSILIEDGDTAVVIDTGCEFRLQALGAGITHLDGVLYTHAHADHLMGLDDLRVFSSSGRFPIYGFQSVLDSISRIFPAPCPWNFWIQVVFSIFGKTGCRGCNCQCRCQDRQQKIFDFHTR